MARGRDVVRVVAHRDDDEEEEAESSEEEAELSEASDEEEEEAEEAAPPARAAGAAAPPPPGNERVRFKLSLSKAAGVAAGGCKACGSLEHQCGFVGSTYQDCPNRACYLCKKPGHTTATCPYRVGAAAEGSTEGGRAQPRTSSVLRLLRRECARGSGRPPPPPAPYAPPPDWRVSAAVLKLHSRRITDLQWHPRRPELLVSGDKRGQLGFWDCCAVTERTVLDQSPAGPHHWLVSAIRFLPQHPEHVFSASVDGGVARTCVETFQHSCVGQLNGAAVWSEEEEDQDWRSIYAMDSDASRGVLFLGDDTGCVTMLDPRAQRPVGRMQAGKVRTKLCALAVSPGQPNLLATAGNDHVARIWDVRRIASSGAAAAEAGAAGAAPLSTAQANKALGLALATLPHPRVISAVAWSPLSGRKLMSTCTDNRLRVWPSVSSGCGAEAEVQIVHSHDFNRYLTAFKAVWDPKDPTERLAVIGRYISEDVGGAALHPIDFIDTGSGRLLKAATDVNVTTICPVIAVHGSLDKVAAGSSRNIYVWEPYAEEEEEEGLGVGDEAGGAREDFRPAFRFRPRMLDLDEGKSKGKKGKQADSEEEDDGPKKKKPKGGKS